MSQENVEAYKRAIEAFNRRHLDTILALAHEEVVVEPRFAAMEGGHRGHDGVRRWWENLLEVLPDFQLEVGQVRDLGEVTLARIHARGHGPGVPRRWTKSSGRSAGGGMASTPGGATA